jgi:hypothetical protein
MIMTWLTENRRNKLICNYGFWDGNKAETSATISWLSNVGYVIMVNVTYIFTGGIVNNRLRLRSVTWGTFLENHLQDSLVRQL